MTRAPSKPKREPTYNQRRAIGSKLRRAWATALGYSFKSECPAAWLAVADAAIALGAKPPARRK
jgi:hypothetical protein